MRQLGEPLVQLKAGLDSVLDVMGINDDHIAHELAEIGAAGFCRIDDKTLLYQNAPKAFADDLALPQDGNVHHRWHLDTPTGVSYRYRTSSTTLFFELLSLPHRVE